MIERNANINEQKLHICVNLVFIYEYYSWEYISSLYISCLTQAGILTQPIPLTSTTCWSYLIALKRTGSASLMRPILLSKSATCECISLIAFTFLATSISGYLSAAAGSGAAGAGSAGAGAGAGTTGNFAGGASAGSSFN